MTRSDLVENYKSLVESYDLLRQRRQKAIEQKGRFAEHVLTRVLGDYDKQILDLENKLLPSDSDIFDLVAELERDRAKLDASRASLVERRDELELRNVIGEYSSQEYQSMSAQVESELQQVAERMADLDEDIQTHNEILHRAGAHERKARGPAKKSGPGQIPVAVPSPSPAPNPPPVAKPVPDVASVFERKLEPPANELTFQNALKLTPAPIGVGGSLPPVPFPLDEPRSGSAGNAFEMIIDPYPSSSGRADSALSSITDSAVSELHGLTELDSQWANQLDKDYPDPVDLNQVLLSGGASSSQEVSFSPSAFDQPHAVSTPQGDPSTLNKTGYLIRHFNRPGEDRYEIKDDKTSIGRGRDNQIQIKDDTKVSRYHCRILRESTGFYIEDNNSSNGTMVNEELINRRKIEGGEDLTIGETIFRFELR